MPYRLYNSLRSDVMHIMDGAKQLDLDGLGPSHYARIYRKIEDFKTLGIIAGDPVRVGVSVFYGNRSRGSQITVYPVNLERANYCLRRLDGLGKRRIVLDEI
ncbi:MAG: hypothetical protein HYT70_01375 [Candidatus Aenigmarchaeota archaeon]|nr:hypothetical protein [Candidatus Aenigmarchaeota archaeon]